jgi:hypothetical protein
MPAKGQDAMQKSIFLARLIGPVLLAIGIGVLLNAPVFRILAVQFLHSYALIFISGLLTLTAGLAIVLAHNVWVGDWRLIITVLGWLGVIGGAVRIVVPQKVAAIGSGLLAHGIAPLFGGFVMLVVGALLAYYGYAELLEGKPARRSRRKRS